MIAITGDTHIPMDGERIFDIFPEDSENNYLIIAGDFGLLWTQSEDKDEREWKRRLNDANFITLFADGNHENHNRLDSLPTIEFMGGTAGIVSDKIYHLKRGEVYTINGRTFLTIGGAFSIDAYEEFNGPDGPQIVWRRVPNKSWWAQEQIRDYEIENTLKNLAKYDRKFDYIVTHTCPTSIARTYLATHRGLVDKLGKSEEFLEYVIGKADFKRLFFGHWHNDWSTYDYKDGKKRHYHMLYYGVKIIEELEELDKINSGVE